jgi:hypothetical protein
MGHGAEPTPEEVIQELRAEIESQEAFIQRLRDKRPMIHGAMIKAMRLAKAVTKDGFNQQQSYPFRGIDGTVNVLGPALREAGVFVTPEVLESVTRDVLTTQDKKTRETTVRVKFTFWAEDGSHVSAIVPGESLDVSDKGTAKAMSVAFRIALLQIFALPTQEPTTDHDGHYHTRTGTPTLSGWTASYGRAMIDHGDPDEVIDFWPAVVESSSIEAPCGYATGETWGEGIAKRIAEFIAEEQSREVLRELYGKLKKADMLSLTTTDASGSYKLGDLVIERGKTVVNNRTKAFDHCMALVTGANDLEALLAAEAHVQADFTDGPLTQEQRDDLLTVAIERRPKLEHASVAAFEFLPAYGESWEAFVAAIGSERVDRAELTEFLTGTSVVRAACDFGPDGVQRFIDAVKRAHSGWQTITSVDRAELFAGLRSQMHAAGITWHETIE